MDVYKTPVYGNKFDMEFAMEEEHRKMIEHIINAKSYLRLPYYLYIVAKAGSVDNTVRVRFATMFKQPPQILGSACYLVDNRSGCITKLWCSPFDIPVPDILVAEWTQVQSLVEQNRQLPVVVS